MGLFDGLGIKTLLPVVESYLPDAEEKIKEFLDGIPLCGDENRAGVIMFKSENGNVLLCLVAFDDEFNPVRQITRMPLLEFVKLLLNQVKQVKK